MHSRLWLPAFSSLTCNNRSYLAEEGLKKGVFLYNAATEILLSQTTPQKRQKKLSCNPEKMAENTTFDSWQGPSTYRAASDAAAPSRRLLHVHRTRPNLRFNLHIYNAQSLDM